mmetsp:Transcript_6965/g.17044  ORF Transcript_6965/g.17044 Transcript_6965/m.17044 type:complete len:218 (+) Transcript_6965:540-1193(+)
MTYESDDGHRRRPERHPPHRPRSVGRARPPPHRRSSLSRRASAIAVVVAAAAAISVSIDGVRGWAPRHHPSRLSRDASVPSAALRAVTPTEDEAAAAGDATTQAPKEKKASVDDLFKGYSSSAAAGSDARDNNDDDDGPGILDQVDGFLDKPFFDPDAYEDDDDSFLGKIAGFVKADYELFEAAFVACFFLLLITVAKDLLRAQMVASGVTSSGKLF